MIKSKFWKNRNGNFYRFEISGHSGYSESGSDIVCAAVSAISQTAVFGLCELKKLKATVNINEKSGFLSFESQDPKIDEESAKLLIDSMFFSLENISRQYGDYIKTEVHHDF